MAKDERKPIKSIKTKLIGGRATPNPVLGQAGINMQEFIQEFNEKTGARMGETIPTKIFVFEDKSYTFTTTLEPAASMIMNAANIKKGSGEPNKTKVGTITKSKLAEVAEAKLPDLNAFTIEAAVKILEGTCKQMGLTVVEG